MAISLRDPSNRHCGCSPKSPLARLRGGICEFVVFVFVPVSKVVSLSERAYSNKVACTLRPAVGTHIDFCLELAPVGRRMQTHLHTNSRLVLFFIWKF